MNCVHQTCKNESYLFTVLLKSLQAVEDKGPAEDVPDEHRADADRAEDDRAAGFGAGVVALASLDASVDNDVRLTDVSRRRFWPRRQ